MKTDKTIKTKNAQPKAKAAAPKKTVNVTAPEATAAPVPVLVPKAAPAPAAVAAPKIAAAPKPPVATTTSTAPKLVITTETIAARAYTIWEQKGRPQGSEVENWLLAERQLKQEAQAFSA